MRKLSAQQDPDKKQIASIDSRQMRIGIIDLDMIKQRFGAGSDYSCDYDSSSSLDEITNFVNFKVQKSSFLETHMNSIC